LMTSFACRPTGEFSFLHGQSPWNPALRVIGALVPAIRDPRFYDIPCSGKTWILIGDAAGHVDPILKEGIRYAMWSAELAAEAITNGNPANFDMLWRRAYYPNLVAGCRLLKYFYHPRILEFNIVMASRSNTCESLIASLVADEQNYRGLKKRFVARLPRMVYEGITVSFRKRGHRLKSDRVPLGQ
jgi:flavin-dependent dehydrogenase